MIIRPCKARWDHIFIDCFLLSIFDLIKKMKKMSLHKVLVQDPWFSHSFKTLRHSTKFSLFNEETNCYFFILIYSHQFILRISERLKKHLIKSILTKYTRSIIFKYSKVQLKCIQISTEMLFGISNMQSQHNSES